MGTPLIVIAMSTFRWWAVRRSAIARCSASMSSAPSTAASGREGVVRDPGPVVGLERDFAVAPRTTADFHRSLEHRELARPRREAAFTAVLIELLQDGHQRVISGLHGQVLDFLTAHLDKGGPPSY